MLNEISAEDLSPVIHKQAPVITTEVLARLYGTEPVRIRNNFSRNKSRFIEGKHYFLAKGDTLESLRVSLRDSQNPIASNVRALTLWTERGAARHAKMLETDQAWEVFERLEDCYFCQVREVTPAIDLLNIDMHLCIRNGEVAFIRQFRPERLVSPEEALSLLKKQGWIVMQREELASRLSEL